MITFVIFTEAYAVCTREFELDLLRETDTGGHLISSIILRTKLKERVYLYSNIDVHACHKVFVAILSIIKDNGTYISIPDIKVRLNLV